MYSSIESQRLLSREYAREVELPSPLHFIKRHNKVVDILNSTRWIGEDVFIVHNKGEKTRQTDEGLVIGLDTKLPWLGRRALIDVATKLAAFDPVDSY